MSEICCVSGHRNEDGLDYSLLERVLKNLIKNGCTRFLCGMARGFDLAAAESLLSLREKYPSLTVVACVPCPGQSDKFSSKDRERYLKVLERCDERIVLSDKYYAGCMHARDRFMVDNADTLVCFLRHKKGGTYYTYKYAEKKGLKIISV